MSIDTIEKLIQNLDDDRIWRIKEIDFLKKQCDIKNGKDFEKILYRKSLLLVLYAHWEGFVKKAGNACLEFISSKELRLNSINLNLLSIHFKAEFFKSIETKKQSSLIKILNEILIENNKKVNINYNNAIDTKSNLNYEAFEEILNCLGIPSKEFQIKKFFIDKKLLKMRNNIAHGNNYHISESEMNELKDEIVSLIDKFKDEIENLAIHQRYIRSYNP